MAPIPKGGIVAVTGAAGFIGGHVVKQLLDKGYRVRACVRDTEDGAKTGFLKAMPGYASGRLTLHAADLDQEGCFDQIFLGANGVAHLSHVTSYTDEAYIRKVCGHIIESINKSGSVTRVAVTSSTAAIMSEADMNELVRRPVVYEDRYPDETNPKRTADKGQGYSMGKVYAERAFADAAEEHGGWEAVTCCPGDNVGPIQSPHQVRGGPWQSIIAGMLGGRYTQNGAYRPWVTVDVRDTAEAHIRLLESVWVSNGERYMAASGDKRNCEDVCASIGRLLPELNHAVTAPIDNFPDHIKEREAKYRGIWAGVQIRNDRSRETLGMEYRDLDTSIRDCAESLIAIAGVKVKTADAVAVEA